MPSFGSGIASGVIGAGVYPDADDLQAYLEAAGLTLSAEMIAQLRNAIAAAIDDFEKAVRRVMVAGEAALRYYDPPTNRKRELFLSEGGGPGDLCGTVTVGYQTVGGTLETLTANEDYRLLPRNAVADGIPYDRILFFNRGWADPIGPSLRGAIQVTGQWGYGTGTLPASVFQAMLARAAWLLSPTLQQVETGGIVAWKDADRSVEYGTGGSTGVASLGVNWSAQYDATVAHYRKIVLA
jgi:hypothetical protein